MTKKLRGIATLVVLTLVGLALAVFVFAPNGMAYLAEISKFAPGVAAALIAYVKAHDSADEAKGARDEAKGAREESAKARA